MEWGGDSCPWTWHTWFWGSDLRRWVPIHWTLKMNRSRFKVDLEVCCGAKSLLTHGGPECSVVYYETHNRNSSLKWDLLALASVPEEHQSEGVISGGERAGRCQISSLSSAQLARLLRSQFWNYVPNLLCTSIFPCRLLHVKAQPRGSCISHCW